jgi:tetratricopeptide (TPR) repeat protein
MGKLQCRTAQNGDDVQSLRKAMTMYLAAIEACPRNNLATNELGVLLAHNGHYVEAETMFRRAVTISPTSTGYHNLAVVEQKLGRPQQAIANQQQADRLAAWERANGDVSRRMGIQWVSPDVLARAGEATETSAEAVAGVGRTQPATATAPSGPAARPAFAPPPLASDATEPAAPARIARPLPAQTRRQLW